MGLREWLLPRDKEFFALLADESRNVLDGARALREMINNFEDREAKYKQIRDLEHKGDTMVHNIFERLDKAFITPIDHEDLAKLASTFDDVIDNIYGVAKRIIIYEIREPTMEMFEFTELVVQSASEIDSTLSLIQKLDQPEVERRCIEVDRLENLADDLLNRSVGNLFKTNDPIQIMKLKEIYERYEIITDKCEDVTDVIHDIVLKNA
jgi:predicted phosphate transport protein (TIGR00153 family)